MERLQFGTRVLLLAMMIFAGLAAPAGISAAAQAGSSTFVSPMTGIPIQTSAPWSVDPTMVIQEEGVESVTIMSDFAFMQVWFMPGSVPLVEARDVVLDSFMQEFGTFIELDRGAYGNVSYSLDLTSVDGMEFGVFSLFLGQRASGFVEYYVFMGPPSIFAQTFASAQQSVLVNGTSVFGGVDGAGLQSILLANAGATGASTTTTEAPPVPQVEPTPPPAQQVPPTQAPVDPPVGQDTPGTGTLTPEQAAYLDTVRSEAVALQGSIGDFVTNFQAWMADTSNDQAVDELFSLLDFWTNYSAFAQTVVPPAGLEDVDALYQAIAVDFSIAAATFLIAIQAGADGNSAGLDDNLALFVTQIADLEANISSLLGLIDQYETAGVVAAAEPTSEPVVSSTDPGDGDAYVAAINDEIASVRDSILRFSEGFELINSNDPADQEEGSAQLSDVLSFWAAYPETAASIPAPAGFEDVDAAYQDLAADVSLLTELFITWAQATSDADQVAAAEDFAVQIDDVVSQLESLEAMLGVPQTGSQTTTTETPPPTREPEPVETPTDLTETGNRGQLPQLPGSNVEPDDTVSPSTDYEDLGLVSDAAYASPQFGIEVEWDDRWAFDDQAFDVVIASDEENAEDWITLVWTGGPNGDITITLGAYDGVEPEDFVAYWESDEYLDLFGVPGEVLLTDASPDRGAVLVLFDDGEEGLVLYREVVCLSRSCDEVATIMIFSPVVDAADMIADAEEGIEIDGESATGVFSTRQINRALDQ